jgi:hypothetical protein
MTRKEFIFSTLMGLSFSGLALRLAQWDFNNLMNNPNYSSIEGMFITLVILLGYAYFYFKNSRFIWHPETK